MRVKLKHPEINQDKKKDKIMEEKKQHGGKRPGSGRPKETVKRKKWSGYLSVETLGYLQSQPNITLSQGGIIDHAINLSLKTPSTVLKTELQNSYDVVIKDLQDKIDYLKSLPELPSHSSGYALGKMEGYQYAITMIEGLKVLSGHGII